MAQELLSRPVVGILAGTMIVLGVVSPATADVTLITDRAALGGDDSVDWGVLGPVLTSVPNPFNIFSNGGLGMLVSKASPGPFERRDQNNGWNGNFAPGDELIWTAFTVGPMTIEFDSLVSGAGAQIQANVFGNFTATIEAFDSGGMSLGSFNVDGVSNSNGDNSAIFIGVLSDSAEIKSISFDVSSGTGDFAINQMDLVTAPADSDGDGIPDDEDACPDSDLADTIVIDDCDSGVFNLLFDDGCTMSDLIAECAEDAANHGQFVSCVSQLTNEWKSAGLINGHEKAMIVVCAAQSDIPEGSTGSPISPAMQGHDRGVSLR